MNKFNNNYDSSKFSDEYDEVLPDDEYDMPYEEELGFSEENDKVQILNEVQVSDFLDAGGSFSKFFDKYEARESQINLTRKICKCFNDEAIGVFEAGTGVGKSLAYLLPSMIWAKKNKKRVVISTGTINLQQQLMEKDVPTAKKILGKEFSNLKVVLVKGRQNFLCLRRLSQSLQENDLFSEHLEELKQIKDWAMTEHDGSRSSLKFQVSDAVWSAVCSESDNCKGSKCPYFKPCFVMKMKKESESASILIANHHILFADLAVRAEGVGYAGTAVLPSYENIVIDEAHGIEEAVLSFFSGEVNRFSLNKQINLLYRSRRGKAAGVLQKLCAISSEAELFPQMINIIEKVFTSFNVLEEKALSILRNSFSKSLTQISSSQTSDILISMQALFKSLYALNFNLKQIIDSADKEIDEDDLIYEASVILRRLKEFASLFENFLHWQDFEMHVFWFEKINLKNGEAIRFIQTPLDLSKIMRRSVFMPMSTVVCVSATLQINNNFDFWLSRIGLKYFDDKQILLDEFLSPFPYSKNVIFNIPQDMPLPDQENFQQAVNQTVLSLLESTQGKTLILFTSYSSLKETCEYVRDNIMEDIEILQQGEDDRMKLLNKFKEDINSSLFATTSFWAGVDVPGESLSHVILVKLPFSVPNDPIFKAKSDLIEKAGGNSFMQLSVPEAVIQFRQGFGRLMRSNEDRGIVSVLDKRLLVKRYGGIFISSVPKTIQCFSSTRDILNKIEDFLYNWN